MEGYSGYDIEGIINLLKRLSPNNVSELVARLRNLVITEKRFLVIITLYRNVLTIRFSKDDYKIQIVIDKTTAFLFTADSLVINFDLLPQVISFLSSPNFLPPREGGR